MKNRLLVILAILTVAILVGFGPVLDRQVYDWLVARRLTVQNDTELNNLTVNGQITLNGGQVITNPFQNLVIAAPTSLATQTPALNVNLENGVSNNAEFRKNGTPQVIVGNDMRLSANAGAVASAPTAAATSLPGLVANSESAGGVIQEWRKANTPVAYAANSGQFNLNAGVSASVPTAVATSVPAVMANAAGVSNPLEVQYRGTPQIQALAGGGVKIAAPTAVATTVPVLLVQGQGASNQIEIRNASNTPVAQFAPDGSPSLPASSIDSTEIANVSRSVNIPLGTFIDCQTDAGALIGFDTTADTLADYVNSATDGTGFVIRFDDTGSSEDQSSEICSQLNVPPDYASGGTFTIRALKDAHTGATEVINCAVSVNGAALETAGTVTTTASASTSYTCTPTIAALAAGDSLSFYLSITSDSTMNDLVDVAAVRFTYTATQ